jgi:hypothetical protein
MEKFEYKTVLGRELLETTRDLGIALNRLGEEGWELITIKGDSFFTSATYFFKRKIK